MLNIMLIQRRKLIFTLYKKSGNNVLNSENASNIFPCVESNYYSLGFSVLCSAIELQEKLKILFNANLL